MKLPVLFTLLISACLLSGCASITGSSGQNLAVEARTPSGELITDAKCKLSNDKGTWFVNSPDTVTVQKSGADLHVVCQKDGFEPGSVKSVSRANAGMWGNVILGGGVGAIIDHSKGTAYNYPNSIQVKMEQLSRADKKEKIKNS